MKIIIEKFNDEDYKNAPYFWYIWKNDCNCGHGWSATEEQAAKDAADYWASREHLEDVY